MTLRIPPGIACASAMDDEYWLLRVGDERPVCLSRVSHLIWQACDGAASVEEAIETLSLENGWMREEIDEPVRRFAQHLLDHGYLKEVSE